MGINTNTDLRIRPFLGDAAPMAELIEAITMFKMGHGVPRLLAVALLLPVLPLAAQDGAYADRPGHTYTGAAKHADRQSA